MNSYMNSNTVESQIDSGVTQELVTIIDETFYIPTSLILDVFYNSERIFGVQIKNVEYEIQDEIPIPIDIAETIQAYSCSLYRTRPPNTIMTIPSVLLFIDKSITYIKV